MQIQTRKTFKLSDHCFVAVDDDAYRIILNGGMGEPTASELIAMSKNALLLAQVRAACAANEASMIEAFIRQVQASISLSPRNPDCTPPCEDCGECDKPKAHKTTKAKK